MHRIMLVTLAITVLGCEPREPALDAASLDAPLGDAPLADGAGPDTASSDAGPDGGSGCEDTCAVSGPSCGTYTNACGDVVRCERCAFGRDALPAPGVPSVDWLSVVSTGEGTFEVAYALNTDGLHVARWQAGTWTDELAVPDVGSFIHLDLAIGADGTRWVAFEAFGMPEGPGIYVRHAAPGGPWLDDGRVANVADASLAIDADGVAHVGYASSFDSAIFVATRTGGAWVAERVTDAFGEVPVDLAFVGATAQLALGGDDGLTFAERGPSGWSFVEVGPRDERYNQPLTLVHDDAGEPAIAALSSELLVFARRSGGVWTTSSLELEDGAVPRSIAALPDGRGGLWVATGGGTSHLVHATAAASPVQRLHRYCRSNVALFASAGVPSLVDGCDGPVVLRPYTGPLDATVATQCLEIEESLCLAACTVCDGPRCCWSYDDGEGRMGSACQSAASCERRMALRICGEVNLSPSAVATCRDELPITVCTADEYAALPTSCALLH